VFCPKCKTEYRSGFTKCADCGVSLVTDLPGENSWEQSAKNVDAPTDSQGRLLLWSGLSQAIYAEICEALRLAHIPYCDEGREFGVLPTLTQLAALIWIEPKDFPSAQTVLEKVLTNSDQLEHRPDQELSSDNARVNPFNFNRRIYNRVPDPRTDERDEDQPAETDLRAEDDFGENFDPEQARAEVWSGDDPEIAEYLKNSLEGVGIGCLVHDQGQRLYVLVLPASETRAKEIVREVVEGTPPQ